MTRPDFNKAKDEVLANDPAVKAGYDALAPEYEAIRQELCAKLKKGEESGISDRSVEDIFQSVKAKFTDQE